MARRPRLFAPGILYHVLVRGNHRQKTFLTENDYLAYTQRLAEYRRKFGVTVHAFCLMPNHAHLLLESSQEPLAKFMQGLQQAYTQYFNRVHRKVGHLFQGRYKAIVCQSDEYLLTLIRYIHLNPVRAKLTKRPEEHRWSGHHAYLAGKATDILDPTAALKLFNGRAAYRRFVLDGLGEGHRDDLYEVTDQMFLGAEDFGEKVRTEIQERRPVRPKESLDQIMGRFAPHVEISQERLRSRDRQWEVSTWRTIIAYIVTRKMGFGVKEVAEYFRRDPTTLSVLLARLTERMRSDSKIEKSMDTLMKIVKI